MAKSSTYLGTRYGGLANFVQYGFGQVEPNHLSAPQSGRVYAQLPAKGDIEILENGQFVKYDYAAGVCDFSADATSGAWMMVFNEVKIYRDRETDADFAMIKQNYNARVYSPIGQNTSALKTVLDYSDQAFREGTDIGYKYSVGTFTNPQLMPEEAKMVPRVLHIEVGDIWTTNTINADPGSLSIGNTLKIGEKGYLVPGAGQGGDLDPTFAVVKVYTMPDMQPGVKIQRVA